MAVGWAKDGAVQDQIDASVEDALAELRARLHRGESLIHCEVCGEEIPAARRAAVAGVRTCVGCQADAERQMSRSSLYNRRGSKDSQLR